MSIIKKHTRNKDQFLDKGGVNQSTAADVKSAVDLKHLQNSDTSLDNGQPNQVTSAELRTHVDDVTIHRIINDAGLAVTDLWSADKISTEISNAIDANNELDELIDVTITAVVDNEILGFNSGSGEWINQTPAELGLSEIGHTHVATDITDFDTEVGNHPDVTANTTARHTQNSDTKLDEGNANEVTAAAIRNILDTSIVTISTEQIANFTATKNALIPVDVTTIPITVTPPATPVTGDIFGIVDSRFNAQTNNITVDFTTATQNLYAASNNWIINIDGGYVEFIYINSTIGWVAKK